MVNEFGWWQRFSVSCNEGQRSSNLLQIKLRVEVRGHWKKCPSQVQNFQPAIIRNVQDQRFVKSGHFEWVLFKKYYPTTKKPLSYFFIMYKIYIIPRPTKANDWSHDTVGNKIGFKRTSFMHASKKISQWWVYFALSAYGHLYFVSLHYEYCVTLKVTYLSLTASKLLMRNW